MRLMQCTTSCSVHSTDGAHNTTLKSMMTLSRSDSHVQDTSLVNVDAVNLFWTLGGAMVVAEGTTYSNVTTEGNRWDVAGASVGAGDGASVVLPLGLPLEQPSTIGSLPSSAITPLSNDDSWIESVRQVLC